MLSLALTLLQALAGCAASAQEGAQRPPIVLVSLDTLRADRLGAWGNPDGLTPNLDRFAAEAVVFEAAYAQANETLFSHASLLTSRYPSELGQLTYDFVVPEEAPGPAEVLSLYGYRAAAFTSGGHLIEGKGLDRGFTTWQVPVDWGSLYHTAPRALAWLDEQPGGEPWLLFVHGYDTHHRYLKPSPFGRLHADPDYAGPAEDAITDPNGTARVLGGWFHGDKDLHGLFSFREPRLLGEGFQERLWETVRRPESRSLPLGPDDTAFIAAVYDGAVQYADAMFGLLMAGLEERGVLDEAVIVVFSDHGESLGENFCYNHRFTLSDADVHVPLMIRMPGGEGGGRRVSDPVALLDIAPTLYELAGATPPADARGGSLAPALRGGFAPQRPAVFSEGVFRVISARSSEGRLTFTGVGADSPFLGDLVEYYPPEGPGLSGDAPQLQGALAAWRRALPPPPDAAAEADPELRRELQERGYWGL